MSILYISQEMGHSHTPDMSAAIMNYVLKTYVACIHSRCL